MAKETEVKETPKTKAAAVGLTEKQKQDWKERKLAILNEKQTAKCARAADHITKA